MDLDKQETCEDYYERALSRLSESPRLDTYNVRFIAHIPWFHHDTWRYIALAPDDKVLELARALRTRDRRDPPAGHEGPWRQPGDLVRCERCGGEHSLEGSGGFLFYLCGSRRLLGAVCGQPV